MNALIVVDIQNDFLPGGALAVNEGNIIIPVVNKLMKRFALTVATQDWHPANHGSFATNHNNRKIGEIIDLNGLPQILWPVHCVQNSWGAEFANELETENIHKIFTKGTDREIDSYSGFFDNGHRKATGLGEYLRAKGIEDVYVTGLATDYCVKFTALDSVQLGFNTFLVTDACRGVNLQEGDVKRAIEEMGDIGVKIIDSTHI